MNNEIKELSILIDSLYEFHLNQNDKPLNKEQIKESNLIRDKIKKKMISLFDSYQASTGGFALANYNFIFYDNSDVEQFVKVTKYSKYYKKFNKESMSGNAIRVSLRNEKYSYLFL